MTDTYTVQRDGERGLRFKGKRLASARSSADRAYSNYSGTTGRWCELALYQTAKGKYIAVSVGRTQWQGEHDRHAAKVCDTVEQVVEFFGAGWLAKELYEEARIDIAEEIE